MLKLNHRSQCFYKTVRRNIHRNVLNCLLFFFSKCVQPSTTKKSDKNHGNTRYIIAGVVVVVLAAIVTAGALVGLHIRHADATKNCIMVYAISDDGFVM